MNDSQNFWLERKKPFFALAPMEDVTDTVFREIMLKVSNPENLNVYYTEFTSTDGLCHEIGKDKVKHRLFVNESEKILHKKNNTKLVAQIWGRNPEKFYRATRFISQEYQFDGIDINMGCPVKKIVKQGACSALIGEPQLAKEIIQATKEATNLPVSVKTRVGLSKIVTDEWINALIDAEPAAIVIHGRIQKDMSDVPADWTQIKKGVEIRNSRNKNIAILGNGDVFSMDIAHKKIEETGVDGVMVGRGIFMNPWFFETSEKMHSPEEKLALLWEHTKLYNSTWINTKNFAILKRFFKIYTHSFNNAHLLRAALMETNSKDEVFQLLKESEIDFESIEF
jgi:nifR3 family TIM-barrel protein